MNVKKILSVVTFTTLFLFVFLSFRYYSSLDYLVGYTNIIHSSPTKPLNIGFSTISQYRSGYLDEIKVVKAVNEEIVYTEVISKRIDPINKENFLELNSSISIRLPSNLEKGLYYAQPYGKSKGAKIYFILRSNTAPINSSKYIGVIIPNFTHQSYNTYGGDSLYFQNLSKEIPFQYLQLFYRQARRIFSGDKDFASGGLDIKQPQSINLNRPNIQGENFFKISFKDIWLFLPSKIKTLIEYKISKIPFHSIEHSTIPVIKFLESKGFKWRIMSSEDLHKGTQVFQEASLLLFLGHDEYWSSNMRTNVSQKLETSDAIIYSGNFCWWKVTIDEHSKKLSCYRNDYGYWHKLGFPEENTFGLSFRFSGYSLGWRLNPKEASFLGVSENEYKDSGTYYILNEKHPVFSDIPINSGVLEVNNPVNYFESDGLPLTKLKELNNTSDLIHITPLAKTINYYGGIINRNIGIIEIKNKKGNGRILNFGSVGWTINTNHENSEALKILHNAILYLMNDNKRN